MGSEVHVTLETLARGAVIERFTDELVAVADNILDPNTDAEAVREITVKVKFKPDKHRKMAAATIHVDSKLAAPSAVGTSVFIRKSMSGALEITEFNPDQPNMFETDETLSRIKREQGE